MVGALGVGLSMACWGWACGAVVPYSKVIGCECDLRCVVCADVIGVSRESSSESCALSKPEAERG